MLLNFTAKNYKSFADEMSFSMVAAPKQNDLSYSLFKGKACGQDYKVQCSSVVYGANASGKSNIISAMDTFRAILLRGNIKNVETSSPNVAAAKLELIPNINSTNTQPVEFSIEFIDDTLLFKYSLSIDLGQFINNDFHRRIVSEELYLNNNLVFQRSETGVIGHMKHIKEYLLFDPNTAKTMESIANISLNDEELYLTNGFKVVFSPELVKIFISWIEQKFIVVFRADSIKMVEKIPKLNTGGLVIEKNLNKAAKVFSSSTNDIGYMNDNDNDNNPTLCSILDTDDINRKTVIQAEIFESYGTVRFVTLLPLIFRAFSIGATLVIDEFDASIHPSALMNIINMFHNDSINKNQAQLIFNTHNPIFLNSNLFRRDEIKFVQRNHDTGNSELYALSDFGTSGKNGVRNSMDYMKYYLNYSYGAIEDVDFTHIFENIINHDDSENNGGE